MSRRERLERKLQLRREWAEKAEARSEVAWDASLSATAGIPLGQPILVGHHSERRHRRALERAQNKATKGLEEHKLAEHHQQCAAGIAVALDRSIFSDDENAIAELEQRIAERTEQRERMVRVNKLYRKGDAEGLKALGLDLEQLRAKVKAVGYSWVTAPYESYQLSNLSGRITADKKRVLAIKARQARAASAEAAGGLSIERHPNTHGFGPPDGWVRVTFAEKPDRETIDALKAAGFHWGGGSWSGEYAKLPICECCRDLKSACSCLGPQPQT